MSVRTADIPARPVVREGTRFEAIAKGAVHISGPLTDAFILDDGTATVLRACDGRPLDALCEEFRRRYGWTLSEQGLRGILAPWASQGYLEGIPPPRSGRMVRMDPGGLLTLLGPLGSLSGRRWVAWGAGMLAAAGYTLTFVFGLQLLEALSPLVRWKPPAGALLCIPAYYLGYSVTAFFHEIGHALVVQQAGGEVPEIGIKRSLNFYVLANREVLEEKAQRSWYYAGGLLSDLVWWVVAWVWWLLFPGPVPLFLLVPQCVYFLVYAYAPSGNSDMSLLLREQLGWSPLPRAGRAPGWRSRWSAAPPTQLLLEIVRYLAALLLVAASLYVDPVLLLVYAVYRIIRRGVNRL